MREMRMSASAQAKVVPDIRGGMELVHGVEVQSWRAALQQVLTQPGNHFEAEGTDAVDIITETLQALAQPARNLGAAVVAEACQVAVIGDGHDAGNYRYLYAQLVAAVQIAEIRVRVIEILRNGAVGTGVDLLLEEVQILFVAFRFRMNLRIAGHFDVKVIAGMAADEFHQLVGIVVGGLGACAG